MSQIQKRPLLLAINTSSKKCKLEETENINGVKDQIDRILTTQVICSTSNTIHNERNVNTANLISIPLRCTTRSAKNVSNTQFVHQNLIYLTGKPKNQIKKTSNINLDLDEADLKVLLRNFYKLEGSEQQILITHLKKLETDKPDLVDKLKRFARVSEPEFKFPEEKDDSECDLNDLDDLDDILGDADKIISNSFEDNIVNIISKEITNNEIYTIIDIDEKPDKECSDRIKPPVAIKQETIDLTVCPEQKIKINLLPKSIKQEENLNNVNVKEEKVNIEVYSEETPIIDNTNNEVEKEKAKETVQKIEMKFDPETQNNEMKNDKNFEEIKSDKAVEVKVGTVQSDNKEQLIEKKFDKEIEHKIEKKDDKHIEQKIEKKEDKQIEQKNEKQIEQKIEKKEDKPIEQKDEKQIEQKIEKKEDKQIEQKDEIQIVQKNEKQIEQKIEKKEDKPIEQKDEKQIEQKNEKQIEQNYEKKIEHKIEKKEDKQIEQKDEKQIEQKIEKKEDKQIEQIAQKIEKTDAKQIEQKIDKKEEQPPPTKKKTQPPQTINKKENKKPISLMEVKLKKPAPFQPKPKSKFPYKPGRARRGSYPYRSRNMDWRYNDNDFGYDQEVAYENWQRNAMAEAYYQRQEQRLQEYYHPERRAQHFGYQNYDEMREYFDTTGIYSSDPFFSFSD